jgi:adenylate cyclase
MNAMNDTAAPAKSGCTEIERKFLVRELPNLHDAKKQEILQGYLAVDADGTEVRVRRIGERHVQTVKTGAGLKRGEIEIDITPSQFDSLWPATEKRRLEKVRFELKHGRHVIELDLYRGTLAGLKVAEVEFDSEQESIAFTPPTWFGPEITEDSAYKNRNLAIHGLPKKASV